VQGEKIMGKFKIIEFIMKIMAIFEDGKFNYEDKDKCHELVDDLLDEFCSGFGKTRRFIWGQIAYWIVEEAFWHLKKYPDIPDAIPVE
jgi:hypothetical protein